MGAPQPSVVEALDWMKRAKSPPPTGDVTIVFLGKVFQGTWRGGTVRHATSGNLIQANVKRSDEGVTWIRGHHQNSSAEVKALLAAYALRPPHPTFEEKLAKRGFIDAAKFGE